MSTTRTPKRGLSIALAATVAVLLGCAIGSGSPVGASPLVPAGHNAYRPAAGPRPHGAPGLTRYIFSVTDLTTGITSTVSSDSVSLSMGCGDSTTFFCLKMGSTDSFTITTATPVQAGQNLTNPIMTIDVGGAVCGEFQTLGSQDIPAGYSSSITVDQFASDLSTMALQVGCSNAAFAISGTIALNAANTTPGEGYYLYDNFGDTFGFANDSYLTYLGNPGFDTLNAPVVGMATTPTGGGYWMTAADGGVFAYGDAGFYGSTGNIHLNQPIVGMAATSSGQGYWFVAADGGVFAYGDAGFYGSMGAKPLNQPIVGMAATPDDKGYWLVAADGGVFAFGDAAFYGSTGNIHLNKPIVGMTSTTDGKGYWFVASDGGVFAYGDAGFHGSAGATPLNEPITGMLSTSDDGGYLLVASDGGVFNYGDAPFEGSLGGQGITGVVGAVA